MHIAILENASFAIPSNAPPILFQFVKCEYPCYDWF
jgi:hypothetical protein